MSRLLGWLAGAFVLAACSQLPEPLRSYPAAVDVVPVLSDSELAQLSSSEFGWPAGRGQERGAITRRWVVQHDDEDEVIEVSCDYWRSVAAWCPAVEVACRADGFTFAHFSRAGPRDPGAFVSRDFVALQLVPADLDRKTNALWGRRRDASDPVFNLVYLDAGGVVAAVHQAHPHRRLVLTLLNLVADLYAHNRGAFKPCVSPCSGQCNLL